MRKLRSKLTGSVVNVDDATADRLSPTEWEALDAPTPAPKAPRKSTK